MKRLIVMIFILFFQFKTIGQNTELISNPISNQNIERIDSIAKKLNLKGGDIVKVFAKFTVDENGEIKDIEARGPHVLFEQEAIRIINLIPKLDPKEFKNGVKEMKYTLPISFVIETEKERITRVRKEKRKKKKELKKLNK